MEKILFNKNVGFLSGYYKSPDGYYYRQIQSKVVTEHMLSPNPLEFGSSTQTDHLFGDEKRY
jgi:hypothetical protein